MSSAPTCRPIPAPRIWNPSCSLTSSQSSRKMLAISIRRRLARPLRAAELPPDELRWVSHSFVFVFDRDGARAVAAVVEESTGGGYWHAVGWRRQSLTARAVANARRQMEALAERHGGAYEGWTVQPLELRGP